MEIRKFNLVDMVHVYLNYKFNYTFPQLLAPGKNLKKDTSQRLMCKLLNEHYRKMYELNHNYINYDLIKTETKQSANLFLSIVSESIVYEDDIKNYNIRCFADFEAWMDFNYWNIKIVNEALEHPDYCTSRKEMPNGRVIVGLPKSVLGDFDGEMFNSSLKSAKIKKSKLKRKRNKKEDK